MKTVGIPIKLLHEAEGHEVLVELKSGDLYRGKLVSAQDNWNCQLKQVVHTKKDGSVVHVEDVFLRDTHNDVKGKGEDRTELRMSHVSPL